MDCKINYYSVSEDSMLRSLKRAFQSRKPRVVQDSVNLDKVSRSLAFRKELGSVYDQKKTEAEVNLINQVFMVGHSTAESMKPELLWVYPCQTLKQSPEEFERILQFCYPSGPYKVDSDSESYVNQFVYGLNDNGSLLFGVCTHCHFYGRQPFFSKRNDDSYAYCLCTITSQPQFAAHLQFHKLIIRILLGEITDVECPPSGDFLADPDESVIRRLASYSPKLKIHSVRSLATVNPDGVPYSLTDALIFYSRIRVSDTTLMTYTLTKDMFCFVSTTKESIREIGRFTFDFLFSSIGVANVVRLLRSLILERRVLIISSDIAKVTLAVLAALPLTEPLGYKGAILPILPDNDDFLAYLDTPVPFCFGALASTKLNNYDISSDVTVVYLDNGYIDYPEDIPHMPNAKVLRASIKDALNHMQVTVPDQRKTEEFIQFWVRRKSFFIPTHLKRKLKCKFSFCPPDADNILSIIESFTSQFVGDKLAGCRVRDLTDPTRPVVGFVKEVYMLQIDPVYADFFDELVSTQTFQAYCEDTF